MKTALRNRLTLTIIIALFASLPVGAGLAQPTEGATSASQTNNDVKLPETPAAKTFAAFLKAFNSGDIEVMKKFHTDHAGNPENAQKDMEFYQQSGGIKVVGLGKSSDYALEVIVETKNDGARLNFALEVDSQAPHAIQSIRVRPA